MISQSDKFLIEKLIEIRNRGYYANGRETTDLYNRVFSTHLSVTSCSSCLRHRINQLEKELRRQEAEEAKALEEAQVAENNEDKKEEQENGHVRKGSTRKKRNSQTVAD